MSMKFFRRVVMLALLAAGSVVSADNVLYWMVNNPWIGDSSGGYALSESGERIMVTDARVAAFKESDMAKYASSDTHDGVVIYLNLYYPDEGGRWVVDGPEVTEFPVDSAYVDGSGVMDSYGMASLDYLVQKGAVNLAEYCFAVELGAWSDPEAVDAQWVLQAVSDTVRYNDLNRFIRGELGIQGQQVWIPDGYAAVPEPSGGLLLLFGGALLALRRRRR